MGKISRFRLSGLVRAVFLPLAVVAILLCFFTGLSNLRAGEGDEGRHQLEDSIRRTAVACYAAEGIYPPTVEYMEEHYGLQVDRDRYFVDYRPFASNLMPDFTVLEIGGEGARTESETQGVVRDNAI